MTVPMSEIEVLVERLRERFDPERAHSVLMSCTCYPVSTEVTCKQLEAILASGKDFDTLMREATEELDREVERLWPSRLP